MGDPRKQKNKFQRPSHPWQKARIEEEKVIFNDYGLKNKTEIWKVKSILKNFNQQAKRLITAGGKQAELEQQNLIRRLQRLGLLQSDANLDAILGLTPRNLFDRRLESVVHRKGLSQSMRQARQFITHGHVAIGNKKITAPGYFVRVEEENLIQISGNSVLQTDGHPAMIRHVKKIVEKVKKQDTYKRRRSR